VALGDGTDSDALRAALGAVRIGERSAPVYLKLGFAGVPSVERITALLQAANGSARGAGIVAVGYADSRVAGSPLPEDVLAAAVAARVRGFLVDTWRKDGGRLLDHLAIDRLAALSRRARQAGLLFALAGSLDPDAIARLAGIADVLGVRGAACRNGRSGAVDERRVARLRQRVGRQPARLPT
jgi:uncharacterized protein (UPF0264 family)